MTELEIVENKAGEIAVNVCENAHIDVSGQTLYINDGREKIKTYVEETIKPELGEYESNLRERSVQMITAKTVESREQLADYANNTVKPNINSYGEQVLGAYLADIQGYAESARLSAETAERVVGMVEEIETDLAEIIGDE